MGFFDKIKKMVGQTGVKLEWKWIESPFPFDDPMIKATILVIAEGGSVTVIGITGTFIAKYTNAEGEEETIELGEEIQKPNKYHSTNRNGKSVPVFPCTLNTGESESFGYYVSDLDLKKSLGTWRINDAVTAKAKGVKFIFKGEVDIEETVGPFDPSIEHEIIVN